MDEEGYVVLRGLLERAEIVVIMDEIARRLELARRDPTWKDGGTLSLDGLRDIDVLAPIRESPRLRTAIGGVLDDDVKLLRISYRAPLPGFGAQALHTDYFPYRGRSEVATAIIALVDFTAENGATRVVPGSHRIPRLAVPKQSGLPFSGERVVTCRAGDAIVFNGHLWHSGTQNRLNETRHALQVNYARHGARQYAG